MRIDKKFKRQCCYCRAIKDKKDLIRITRDSLSNKLKINTDNDVQGRSVYICKSNECITNAIKKKKIEACLKCRDIENIKEELNTVLKK